MEPLVFLV